MFDQRQILFCYLLDKVYLSKWNPFQNPKYVKLLCHLVKWNLNLKLLLNGK